MKKLTILILLFTVASFAFAQSVEIKDNDTNTLMQIDDQGTTGELAVSSTITDSLKLNSLGGAPVSTVNKLYNEGGTLKWNGSALATGSSLWTLGSGNVYRSTGNVGIGTVNPGRKLTVSSTTSDAYISLENTTYSSKLNLYSGDSGTTYPYVDTGTSSTPLRIQPNGGDTYINAEAGGKVGIGTTTPAQKLDVAGTAQMTGFKMVTGVVNGHVLTTDGSGVGSWQTPQGADNLGNHIATQDIDMATYEVKLNGGYLSGDGDDEGVYVHADGIIDLNKQSRARAGLMHPQLIPPGVWMPIEFDDDFTTFGGYDEQAEFTLWGGGSGSPSIFSPIREGYYQINARTEFLPEWQNPQYSGYVSIAIFVNGLMYAQGNKLVMGSLAIVPPGEVVEILLQDNNAPNVSDVVWLMPGDTVVIHVWQTVDGISLPIMLGMEKTYVSIHKVS